MVIKYMKDKEQKEWILLERCTGAGKMKNAVLQIGGVSETSWKIDNSRVLFSATLFPSATSLSFIVFSRFLCIPWLS